MFWQLAGLWRCGVVSVGIEEKMLKALLVLGLLALAAGRTLDPQDASLAQGKARKVPASKFATRITPDPSYKPLM